MNRQSSRRGILLGRPYTANHVKLARRRGAQLCPPALNLIAMICLLSVTASIHAQETPPSHPYQVFVNRDVDSTGLDRLIFIDMLTGQQTSNDVYGERYTIIGREVLYFDTSTNRVKLAVPDGTVRDHPFIQLEPGSRRVDWLVDGDAIVWTQTLADAQNRLSTSTSIARIGGSESRLVLNDGPYSNGVRALPVALSPDRRTLYMDTHPDGISQFTPFRLYAGLLAVSVETGEITPLPDEQPANCLCGADIRRDWFVRLRLTDDLRGFDLHVYNLASGVEQVLNAPRLNNYTSGDVLLTPDGRQAVYGLARVSSFGTADQSIQMTLMLVDLTAMTQRELTTRITTFVRPVAWTEDNSAILLVSQTQNGTWKINLDDGRLERIAEATYIGAMGGS